MYIYIYIYTYRIYIPLLVAFLSRVAKKRPAVLEDPQSEDAHDPHESDQATDAQEGGAEELRVVLEDWGPTFWGNCHVKWVNHGSSTISMAIFNSYMGFPKIGVPPVIIYLTDNLFVGFNVFLGTSIFLESFMW